VYFDIDGGFVGIALGDNLGVGLGRPICTDSLFCYTVMII
jgi:hypothetical protein